MMPPMCTIGPSAPTGSPDPTEQMSENTLATTVLPRPNRADEHLDNRADEHLDNDPPPPPLFRTIHRFEQHSQPFMTCSSFECPFFKSIVKKGVFQS